MSRREKILKYLTPDTPQDELDRLQRSFCIPNNAEWLGVFMGAIYPLTREENWELHGIVTPSEAAATFQEIFDNAFYGIVGCAMSECCPIRYNEQGQIEQFDETTGEWELAEYPPVPVRTPIEGQDTTCLTAANATEVMKQLWQAWESTWDIASFMVAVSGLITIIALFIFYPVALPLVLTFFTELYGLMEAIGDDDFDTDKQEIFTCILLCAAYQDGENILFNFDEVIEKVGELWTPGVDINVWAAIEYLLYIIGSDGLNRAGTTTSISSYDCDDCDDCGWCYTFDFELSDGGWFQDEQQVSGCGEYRTGIGWGSSFNGSVRGVYINTIFPMSADITHLEMQWEVSSPYTSAQGYTVASGAYTTRFSVSAGDLAAGWEGTANTSEIAVSVGNNASGNTGDAIIKRVTIRGTGVNPYTTDNC